MHGSYGRKGTRESPKSDGSTRRANMTEMTEEEKNIAENTMTEEPYVTEKDGKPFVISYFPRVNASWCWCGKFRPVKNRN